MREQGGCVTSVLIHERLVMGLLYVVSSVVMAQHSEWLGAYYDRVQSHWTKSQLTPQSRLDHSWSDTHKLTDIGHKGRLKRRRICEEINASRSSIQFM